MSIGLEMLRSASAAPTLLRDSSARVVSFLRGLEMPDGGFRGRAAGSDLYYTVFAVDALLALGAEPRRERLREYVRSFGSGARLDLVHLSCLARLHSRLALMDRDSRRGTTKSEETEPEETKSEETKSEETKPGETKPGEGNADATKSDATLLAANSAPGDAEIHRALVLAIEGHRSQDGGYGERPALERGSAYAAFLAVSALEDLGVSLRDPRAVAASVVALRAADGGFGNLPGARSGVTATSAAAVAVLARLGDAIDPAIVSWFLAERGPDGGFRAAPLAPVTDLLSTATALHILRGMGVVLDDIREECLDFLDSLWTPEGGFRGTSLDETADGEYTFYGLLALGNLA